MTLAAVVALLSSTACTIHVTTGPSSALYRSTPAQPSGIVYASAPRVTEPRHHDPVQNVPNTPSRDRDEAQRPSHPSGSIDPRHAGPTNREVITVATSSHTGHQPGQKPVGDFSQWVQPSGSGQSSSGATNDKPRPHVGPPRNGGDSVSGGKTPTTEREKLRNDGHLQRVAKQDR